MEVTMSLESGSAVLNFSGRLTVANIARCHAALRSALVQARLVSVAFGDVLAADLSLLQLLCAAHRSAAVGGGELTISGHVPTLLVTLAERAGAERCAGGPRGCVLRQLRCALAQED